MADSASPARDPEVTFLLGLLAEGFDRRSWHGPNLRSALRGMTAEEASWRPAPGRHDAWELTLHVAYWKYVVRRRLTGERRGSFRLAGSNFFPRPEGEPTEAAWKADQALLLDEHRRLLATVGGCGGLRGAARAKAFHMIRGSAAHDFYHAGQIQLLKRLRAGG